MVLITTYVFSSLPSTLLIALLGFTLALPLFKMVATQNGAIDKLLPALTLNVIINLLVPLLMAGGLFWATI